MPRREPIPADDADGAGRIQTVTDNLVDAARDDGAGAWQTALAVILPYIRGTLMVAGLFRLIDSIKAFPDRRSNRLILHILVVVLAVLVLGPFLWLLRVSFAKSTAASGHEGRAQPPGPTDRFLGKSRPWPKLQAAAPAPGTDLHFVACWLLHPTRSGHSLSRSNASTRGGHCCNGYSMTSSARASSAGGTVTPSTFAVRRLTTSEYFVGCCTGRSAGLVPCRMRST